ncbi:MAG TPA: sugar-binding protein, partial [Lysinibacillus sp.]|nr:sugar-binding protein [Lysinibacillus sp.]
NGAELYYSDRSYPHLDDVSELLSINYYDIYPPNTPVITTPVLGQGVLTDDAYLSTRSTMSLPTASYLKNIGEDKWTKSYIWYDNRARPIATHSKNYLDGFTEVKTELNFAGVPKKTITKNRRGHGTIPDVIIEENFHYDDQYRLKKHEHEVVGISLKETLAEYYYDEIGQLTQKRVGGRGGVPLQTIDYKYNIRGWLTDINDIDIMNSTVGDLFAYKIRYTQVDGLQIPNTLYPDYKVKPKYNGNIAEVDWKSATPDFYPVKAERYGYVYDGLDRLKAGFYQNPTSRGFRDNHEIVEEYDLNGNIVKLKRTGPKIKNYPAAAFDILTYFYNGNQLTHITDEGTEIGYEGGGVPNTYDDNGNMTIMPDKGITKIDYNFLNLPTSVQQRGNISQYTYRADGVKLKRAFTLNNSAGSGYTTTEYFDGFHYSEFNNPLLNKALNEKDDITQGVKTAGEVESYIDIYGSENRAIPSDPPEIARGLMFFPTAEGFYDFRNKQYIYHYKDQVGNVRLSYWLHPTEQILKVVD